MTALLSHFLLPAKSGWRWSDEDKRRLVAETLAVGGTVHSVARWYGINTSQLFTWRKQVANLLPWNWRTAP